MNRGVWQLEKLSIKYCKTGGSSTGVRDFVRDRIRNFAERFPHVEFETKRLPGRHPVIHGKYKNGNIKPISVRAMNVDEVEAACQRMVDSTGRKMTKISSQVKHSSRGPLAESGSLQGVWSAGIQYGEMRVTQQKR